MTLGFIEARMLPVNGVLWFLDKNWNLLATCYNRPFQVTLSFCFKARLDARPLIGKCFFFFMQMKLIFTRKFLHLPSFPKWGFLEVGNGQFKDKISSIIITNSGAERPYTRIRPYVQVKSGKDIFLFPESVFHRDDW